jgi:hypothetical protein
VEVSSTIVSERLGSGVIRATISSETRTRKEEAKRDRERDRLRALRVAQDRTMDRTGIYA